MDKLEGLKGIRKEKSRIRRSPKILSDIMALEKRIMDDYRTALHYDWPDRTLLERKGYISKLMDENLDKKLITKDILESYIVVSSQVGLHSYEYYLRGIFSGNLLDVAYVNHKKNCGEDFLYFDGKGMYFECLFSEADVGCLILDNFNGNYICRESRIGRAIFNNIKGGGLCDGMNDDLFSEAVAFVGCSTLSGSFGIGRGRNLYAVLNGDLGHKSPTIDLLDGIDALAIINTERRFQFIHNSTDINGDYFYSRLLGLDNCHEEFDKLIDLSNQVRDGKKFSGLELANIIFPVYDSLKAKGAFDSRGKDR